ncbi:MAG: ornithine carbamoyltransferase [Acidobacteriota bacterium]
MQPLKKDKSPSRIKLASPHAPMAHVCQDLDLSRDALLGVLELAAQMKLAPQRYTKTLTGRYLGLLFEKPSLRTRLAFELAMKQLGGDAIVSAGVLGAREPVKDVARNLGRWVNGIAARVFTQSTVDELAQWSGVPVINALSDLYHPCQALADAQTLKERFGRWDGLKVAYVGDGNNVAHSLMLTVARLGGEIAVASPEGYEPAADIVKVAAREGSVKVTNDPREAVAGAHAVYTDVWASMGQEHEAAERRETFAPYQVDEELMALARADAIFMHCLPAHRGEEVTEAVMESPQSVVFDQAENRLHTQKALLLTLLG